MRLSITQIFIGIIGLIIAITTSCLMRYPQYRRPPFREYGACSLRGSLLGGLVMLVLTVLMILIQGGYER